MIVANLSQLPEKIREVFLFVYYTIAAEPFKTFL